MDPSKRMTIIDWEYGNYNYRSATDANYVYLALYIRMLVCVGACVCMCVCVHLE